MIKRLIAIGDSCTYGECASDFFSYPKYVAKAFGFDEMENYGVNGTTICADTDFRPTMAYCEYIRELLPGDMAIITGATNDWIRNVEIGNVSDKTDKTFYGALNIFFERAKERYKTIVVVSSINRLNDGLNKKGYTLQHYRDAIKIKAKEYGFYFIDGTEFEVFPKEEKSRLMPDGEHLNDQGQKLFTKFLVEKIKNLTGMAVFDYNFDNSQKKMVAMGDSITHGTGDGETFGVVANYFAKVIANQYGYELKNYGTNGTTIAEQDEWRPTCSLCNYIDETYKADVLLVAGGTNDYGRNVEIGNERDTDKTTFYGALKIFFEKAKVKYNKIIVITPINRKQHEQNEKGYCLQDYRDAIEKVASKYGATIIDGRNVPIDGNDERLIPDGLHPSADGQKVYSEFLLKALKTIL